MSLSSSDRSLTLRAIWREHACFAAFRQLSYVEKYYSSIGWHRQ
jgi:hypothetical protein